MNPFDTETQDVVLKMYRSTQDVGELTGQKSKFIICIPPQQIITTDFQAVMVSPKHCEYANPILLVALQERQKTCYQEWITDLPLSATTCITRKGDGWEERVPVNFQIVSGCRESGGSMSNEINHHWRTT